MQRHQRNWRRRSGVDVKYRIWRGPLRLHAAHDRLHLTADIGYWISARKKLLGPVKIAGSCGLSEPPRAARLHVSARFFWGHDWRFHAETQVHRNRFANPCRLTRARIDVTPVIDRLLDRRMNRVLREQVAALAADFGRLRNQAETIWRALQMPLRLGERIWLVLAPASIYTTPPRAESERLTTAIGITLQPYIVVGERPDEAISPLPDVEIRPIDAKPALDFAVVVNLPLHEIRERLVDHAASRLAAFGLTRNQLEGIHLDADRGDLLVQSAGYRLRARPMIDKENKRLILHHVKRESGTARSNPFTVKSETASFPVPALVEDVLSWSYEEHLQSLTNALNTALNRSIHPNIQLNGKIDDIELLTLDVEQDRIRASVRLSGRAQVVLQ